MQLFSEPITVITLASFILPTLGVAIGVVTDKGTPPYVEKHYVQGKELKAANISS
jgi:hypothetical protein